MLKNKVNILKDFTSTCPRLPGIYKMFGGESEVLYVGKAKNLRSRLKSYQNLGTQASKTISMLSQLSHIEVIITKDEVEALLLELNLIKQYQPKYNILLKDNKTFPYICLDETLEFPRLYKYRGAKLKGKLYYGPFTSGSLLEESITLIQKIFSLRSCTDKYFKARTRPCILYQIGRCSGPCVGKINKAEYRNSVEQAKNFLSGKSKDVQKQLSLEMKSASDSMDYEKAALYRDRIKALTFIQSQNQFANLDELANLDIICSKSVGGLKAIQIFFIRSGHSLGGKTYYLEDIDETELDTAVAGVLQEFYKDHELPLEILSNRKFYDSALLEQLFLKLYDKKIKISQPKRGKKMDLIRFVEANLENDLRIRTASMKRHIVNFDALKAYFKLDKLDRIEVYDNSHTSGFEAGGVMIACDRNGFVKSDYRKYSMKLDGQVQDDYMMMKNILSRRFKNTGKQLKIPELIIIDGGKGQLSAATEAIEASGISTCIISMAKGQERNSGKEIIYTSDNKPIYLDKTDTMKQYLQILRDEAHRFAITSHKLKRDKAMFRKVS